MPNFVKRFDISRKTPLTSNPSSNDLYISWVIAKSWFMQETPGLNPDWLDEMSSFSIKNSNISKNFPQISSRDIGR